jgi:hypothetical protein
MHVGEREDAGPNIAQTGPDGKTGSGCVWGKDCCLGDSPTFALCDGCYWLEPVEPKDTLACRMAAAFEHVVLHVHTLTVLSIVVYYQPIPSQTMQWSWQHVAQNNRIVVVAKRIAPLNTALNFVLLHLYGCRIHHRHIVMAYGRARDVFMGGAVPKR